MASWHKARSTCWRKVSANAWGGNTVTDGGGALRAEGGQDQGNQKKGNTTKWGPSLRKGRLSNN